jgi:hypothetical protein
MYDSTQVGAADYNHYVQLTPEQITSLIEGSNSVPRNDRKYAILTYPISADFENIVTSTYNRKVYTDVGAGPSGTDIKYICHAEVGASLSDSKWRIEKVFNNGDRFFPNSTKATFTNKATDLAAVSALAYLN